MTIGPTTLAGAVGLKIYNRQQEPATSLLPQRIAVIGSYNPAKTLVVDEVPVLILNEGDAGNRFGYGWPLHRLIKAVFEENGGCRVYAVPQTEVGTAAAGELAFTGTATSAGVLYVRAGNDLVAQLAVSIGDTAAIVGAALETLINAYTEAMITASDATGTITINSKAKTTWGNGIALTVNEYDDGSANSPEPMPTGISVAITDMASGATLPDIDDALDALGTGDEKNYLGITKIVHSYGLDQTTMTKVSTWNGLGNQAVGLFEDTITKPVTTWYADVTAANLSTLVTLGGTNKSCRDQIILGVPTSNSHPCILAAWACGVAANRNITHAERSYRGLILSRAHVGTPGSDRWTKDHANRQTAVESGIATTIVKNGVVTLADVVTTYHPDDVVVSSNGYRKAEHISITQNILNSLRTTFESDSWQGMTLVLNKENVTNITSRATTRDLSDIRAELIALAKNWAATAWLFDASYTIDAIKAGTAVSLREAGNGIDFNLPLIYSGSIDVIDGTVEFDVALTVFLNAA